MDKGSGRRGRALKKKAGALIAWISGLWEEKKTARKVLLAGTLAALVALIAFTAVSGLGDVLAENSYVISLWFTTFSLFLGLWMALSVLTPYTAGKVNAAFGFYEHLTTIIMRLKLHLITIDKNGNKRAPAPILYKIWGDDDARKVTGGGDDEFQKLRGIANEFLNYLSSVGGQAPPYRAIDSYDLWKESKSELIAFLHSLLFIDSASLTGTNTKGQVMQEFNRVTKLLDFFETAANDQIKIFMEEIKEASPRKKGAAYKKGEVDYSLSALIRDVLLNTRKGIRSGLRFIANIESAIPDSLRGDKDAVSNIICCLINNAVDAVPPAEKGVVSLFADYELLDAGTIRLTVEVRGEGEARGRADAGMTVGDLIGRIHRKIDAVPGSGLSFASLLAERMGGDLTIGRDPSGADTVRFVVEQKVRQPERLAEVGSCDRIHALVFERRREYSDSIAFSLRSLGVGYACAASEPEFRDCMTGGNYEVIIIPLALYNMYNMSRTMAANKSKVVLLTDDDGAAADMEVPTVTMPVYASPLAKAINKLQ